MPETQQKVIIYKDGMSNAQHRFEKDLKKWQREGWRVVNIVPTKQAFNRVSQLTVIYEKSMAGQQTKSVPEKNRSR
ncbi:hypothetical protein KDH_11930 [Dictyobacter sp. S3.2.2.5]|uniref:DUF4177 domain-containing protein n=1 Tax=Dictyobacter halimunensis TaxID=3026934 RepID=A0ABQ6FJG7_9CHLR|nr:hypothetical protein KDH_11930 [Dictyobacter sp. S3.2.2.5]